MTTIGLVTAGEMGAAVGGQLVGAGRTVVWLPEGRSERTRERASRAELEPAGSPSELARRCEVLLSICPPAVAMETARQFAGFAGTYVDANAISPALAREIGAVVGEPFVDGGIVGGPPTEQDGPRLYLSGNASAEVAALFSSTTVETRELGPEVGTASALKMCFAAWSKGSAALLLAIAAAAESEGVGDALHDEWVGSLPDLPARADAAARSAVGKGARWVAEMEEIAATFAAAGMPEGFHLAAADVFARGHRAEDDSLEAVVAALLRRT